MEEMTALLLQHGLALVFINVSLNEDMPNCSPNNRNSIQEDSMTKPITRRDFGALSTASPSHGSCFRLQARRTTVEGYAHQANANELRAEWISLGDTPRQLR